MDIEAEQKAYTCNGGGCSGTTPVWRFECKKREQLMEEFKNRFVGFVLGGDI